MVGGSNCVFERSLMAQVSDQTEQTDPVDIPQSFCDQIREFARELPEMNYFEVLGIDRGALPDAVRRAFFERSKIFHPDRYFNKQLGVYDALLHEIYKRVVAAHEVLRDERLRRDYETTLRRNPSFLIGNPSRLLALPGAEKPDLEPEAEAPKRPGRSLRDRVGLRSRETVLLDLETRLEGSRRKARGHFTEAQREIEKSDFVRAASLVRLALAFDPREREYHEALAEVVPQANAEAARAARARGEMLLKRGNEKEALDYLEEAFRLVPTDAELAHLISATLLEHDGALDRATDFARQAVELEEQSAPYHKTLGLLLLERGERAEARTELQKSWQLDPLDKDVKQALSVL